MDPDEDIHTHVNLNCENLGKSPEENPELFTTTKPGSEETDSGEAGESGTSTIPEDKKSGPQKFFENVIWASVFSSGGVEGSGMTPNEVLNSTFAYALIILEGEGSAPGGYSIEGMPFSGGIVGESWYKILICIAIVIMLIRFGYEYSVEQANIPSDQMTIEKIFKPVAQLILGMIWIFCAHYLLALILYLSYGAANALSSALSMEGSLGVDLSTSARDAVVAELGFQPDKLTTGIANAGAMLSGLVTFALPWLASQISAVVVLFICFSRVIELVIRGMILPLALSGGFRDTHRSMHYIMDYAGIAFQSLVIIGVIWATNTIGGVLIKTIIGDGGTGTSLASVSQIAVFLMTLKLAQIGMLLKSQSIAKSVFQ